MKAAVALSVASVESLATGVALGPLRGMLLLWPVNDRHGAAESVIVDLNCAMCLQAQHTIFNLCGASVTGAHFVGLTCLDML